MKYSGTKTWFTAQELADLALPAMPRSKRKINERASYEKWALATDASGAPLARPRQAKGGGLEYHIAILPNAARAELVSRGISIDGKAHDAPDFAQSQLWSWYDSQSEKTKTEAQRRLAIINLVDAFEASGMTRTAAVAEASSQNDVSKQTIWNWLPLIKGVAAHDRLPCLAPRRSGGGAKAKIDADIWQIFKSDYLRPEKPTLSSCYHRAQDIAEQRGITLPVMKTFKRKLEREVDKRVIISRREGADALRQSMPPQKRTVAHLHAMEMVNIDGHKFDVFVKMPDGKVIRPLMVAIQDIYSRKMLSWRIGESESAIQTRLTFADLFRDYGIPKECVLDNGRAFASKWITGGSPTRFRFKIKDDEPTGLLTALGVKIHWAMPYRGQSKPIERAFRDLCDTIAKHPALAGAYTGNNVDAKPENYGEKAIDFDVFERMVARGIAAHNKRIGRRTETAHGRSFDETFSESYAAAPIGKATEEQLRLALLAGEQLKVNRKTGELRIAGNRYWSPAMSQHHGALVTVRFDPDNLHQDVHVYDAAGQYIAAAPIIDDTGFNDIEGAKKRAKMEANARRAAREAVEAEDLLTADQIAAALPDYEDENVLPEPTVIRPVRHRGNTAAALKQKPQSDEFMEAFADAVTHLKLVE